MFQGLKVIGSAGSRDKCEWLKEVGFDHVFNYKERTVDEALKEFAPEGVDLYFDNVTNVFVTSSSHTHTHDKCTVFRRTTKTDFDFFFFFLLRQITFHYHQSTLIYVKNTFSNINR